MNVQTYYSILECLTSPKDVVKKCKELGYTQLILCDHNRLSGMVEFYEACKGENKEKGIKPIKPIFGINLKICQLDSTIKDDYNLMFNVCLIAKNKVGFKNILKIISVANDPERVLKTAYQKIARFDLGCIGSTEGIAVVLAHGSEYEKEEENKEYILAKYREKFSEVYTSDEIYWADARYISKEQEEDWQIQQCILLKCNLKELPGKAIEVDCPINKDNSLPSFSSYKNDIRYDATLKLLDSIEEFEILSKPRVPIFNCPDDMSQKEYLTELCRLGWKRRFPKWDNEEKKKLYAERVKHELGILQGCDLDGYFLIVQDYVNWAKRQGWLVGASRGSVGASLVAYLIRVTELDPIPPDLLFERFYSEDRSAGGIPSLPDIDTDFPKHKREFVIKYIEDRYGTDRVAHISNFGTLKGSGALTEVLKAHDVFDHTSIKNITKKIPPKDKLADKMKTEEEDSLIRYVLTFMPEVLKDLGRIENGKITGEYAYHLEQAIRLEGMIRTTGIHPSGILISNEPIVDVCPLAIENDGNRKLAALEMHGCELLGLVKMDILSTEVLDKMMEVQALLLGESEDQ